MYITRSHIDFLIKNYETFATAETFKCCVLWQLLADIVDGCERPSASTVAPEEGVHSRPPEATTAPPEVTPAPTDVATAPAEAGINSTERP